MPNIFIDLRSPADGAPAPAIGRVTFTPTNRHTNGTAIIMPASFAVALINGVATVDLEPTSAYWCWEITEGIPGGKTRFVFVPSSSTTLNYSDLTDVDPATLPDSTPDAAWYAIANSTITNGIVNNGDLILTRTDGTTINAGTVTGRPGTNGVGTPGTDGADGADGIGFSVSVAGYGAVGDGTTDDTNAINAAEAAAWAIGPNCRLYFPPRNYKTTGTITLRIPVDATQATITYYGTGNALIAGNTTGTGTVTYRQDYKLPRVVYGNTGNWDGTSVGITLLNLNTCNVYVPWVQDFETNLLCIGRGTGFAYNTITLGQLGQGHHNLVLSQDQTGWCNQNVFIGGKLNKGSTRGAVMGDTTGGMLELNTGSTTVSGPNNNTFIGTSIEGNNWDYYRMVLNGARYNTFLNCRWEVASPDTLSRINYTNGAADNRIIGGYASAVITEFFDATSPGGSILDGQGAYAAATIPTTAPQTIPTGVFTPINTWSSMSTRRIGYSNGVFTPRAGRWWITASITYTPNATGRRRASIYTSAGATIDFAEVPGSTQRNTIKLAGSYKFNGTETFVIQTDQNSGADLTLEPTSGYVRMKAELLNV